MKINLRRSKKIIAYLLVTLFLFSAPTQSYARTVDGIATTQDEVSYDLYQQMKSRAIVPTVEFFGDASEVFNNYHSIMDKALKWDDYTGWSYTNATSHLSSLGTSVKVTVDIGYRTSAEQEAALDTKIKEVLTSLNLGTMDDTAKVQAIADWIMSHMVYDHTYTYYDAYHAMFSGTAVCQGYAMLFDKMLEAAGFRAELVEGTLDGGSHGWNIVKLGDQWYYYDLTNADEPNNFPLCKVSAEFLRSFQYPFTWDETQINFGELPTDPSVYPTVYTISISRSLADISSSHPDNVINVDTNATGQDVYLYYNPATYKTEAEAVAAATKAGDQYVLLDGVYYVFNMADGWLLNYASQGQDYDNDSLVEPTDISDGSYTVLAVTQNPDDLTTIASAMQFTVGEAPYSIGWSGTMTDDELREYIREVAINTPPAVTLNKDNTVTFNTNNNNLFLTAYSIDDGNIISNIGMNSTYTDNNVLSAGAHTVKLHITSDITNGYGNYPNNVFEFTINVPSNDDAKGIDYYSPVFDLTYYKAAYPDLVQQFSTDDALFKHFVDYGMAEGQQGSADFNVAAYRNYNPDVAAAFGDDLKNYYLHYIECGKNEGRTAVEPTYVGKYNAADYAAVFDLSFYKTNNPDIVSALKNNDAAIVDHFVDYGMAEGRQGIADFNVAAYRNYNPDVAAAFGDDLKSYYLHYIECGKNEGRTATESSTTNTGKYNAADYAAVFDLDYYKDSNPDVVAALNNDDTAIVDHFVDYGMAEGRQGIADFNVAAYRKYNPDLVTVYGDVLKNYYLHYMACGKNEGRKATESSTVYTGKYNAADYAAVFDLAFYKTNNPDVVTALNNNDTAIVDHFVDYGMAEGRQGSADFNVSVYQTNNPDLVSAYGSDLSSYYLHYMACGKNEGRIAK